MNNVFEQVVNDQFAAYNGDCCEVLQTLPDASVHLSVYSPPFMGLYSYSSSERDMSNARSYDEFMLHYEFLLSQIRRVTLPGRLTGVHCIDVPDNGANLGGGLVDFPGDLIRLHQRMGFQYVARYCVWKEPLAVRNRTMQKSLAHRQIVDDSSLCDNAGADFLLMFRKKGENTVPISHPQGLLSYAGSRPIPQELLKYKGWKGKQTQNRYSHWIWRQYASAFWDDVRVDRVLPYKKARDPEDDKHMHPLQLDVIERCVVLWSNPGETILTPFMGVGSELYGALINDRKAIGVELKPSYYRQAVQNLKECLSMPRTQAERSLFDGIEESQPAESEFGRAAADATKRIPLLSDLADDFTPDVDDVISGGMVGSPTPPAGFDIFTPTEDLPKDVRDVVTTPFVKVTHPDDEPLGRNWHRLHCEENDE